MDEPRDYQNKSEKDKGHMMIAYMHNQVFKKWHEFISKTEMGVTDIEKKTYGEWDWHIHTTVYKTHNLRTSCIAKATLLNTL